MLRVKGQGLLSTVFHNPPVALFHGLVGLIEETIDSPLDPIASHRNPGVPKNEDGTILTSTDRESRTERAAWSDGGKRGLHSGSQKYRQPVFTV